VDARERCNAVSLAALSSGRYAMPTLWPGLQPTSPSLRLPGGLAGTAFWAGGGRLWTAVEEFRGHSMAWRLTVWGFCRWNSAKARTRSSLLLFLWFLGFAGRRGENAGGRALLIQRHWRRRRKALARPERRGLYRRSRRGGRRKAPGVLASCGWVRLFMTRARRGGLARLCLPADSPIPALHSAVTCLWA